MLGCTRMLGLADDDPASNPNGGAIAPGHPRRFRRARLVWTALRELERRDGRYAVVSLCICVGQGIALVIERIRGSSAPVRRSGCPEGSSSGRSRGITATHQEVMAPAGASLCWGVGVDLPATRRACGLAARCRSR